MAGLLFTLWAAGAEEHIIALADRAAEQVPVDDPEAVAWVLDKLRLAGAEEQVSTLLHRDLATHVSLDDLDAVGWLRAAAQKSKSPR